MKRGVAILTTLGMMFFFSISTTFAKGNTLEIDGLFYESYPNGQKDLETLNKMDMASVQEEEEKHFDIYEVKKGDTLYQLAKTFNTTVDDIMELNDLDSSLILIGQPLKIDKQEESEQLKEAKVAKTKAVTNEKDEHKSEEPKGRTMNVIATAYTAECEGCTGITYTGVNLLEDRELKVIAVDPEVIPLGSRVYVENYGYARAEDIGGAIKGNRIDLHMPTKEEALNWGVREVSITVLDEE